MRSTSLYLYSTKLINGSSSKPLQSKHSASCEFLKQARIQQRHLLNDCGQLIDDHLDVRLRGAFSRLHERQHRENGSDERKNNRTSTCSRDWAAVSAVAALMRTLQFYTHPNELQRDT